MLILQLFLCLHLKDFLLYILVFIIILDWSHQKLILQLFHPCFRGFYLFLKNVLYIIRHPCQFLTDNFGNFIFRNNNILILCFYISFLRITRLINSKLINIGSIFNRFSNSQVDDIFFISINNLSNIACISRH
jgi:hypothetical protein